MKFVLNLLFFFPYNVFVLMDTIFFDEKEEVNKAPPLQMWYQNKVLNVLFKEQKELLQ